MRSSLTVWAAMLAVLLSRLATADPRGRKNEGPQDCLRRTVRAKLLEELEKQIDSIIKSLPRDDIKHRKLLPKFGKSMEKPSGISVINEILKFYSEDVFSKKSLEVQKNINVVQLLIASLETDVNSCMESHSSVMDQTEQSEIQAIKRNYHQLKVPGVYKAIQEFNTVLDWIRSYSHMKTEKGLPKMDRP